MWFGSSRLPHGIRINFVFVCSVFLHFNIAIKSSFLLRVCVGIITISWQKKQLYTSLKHGHSHRGGGAAAPQVLKLTRSFYIDRKHFTQYCTRLRVV